MNQAIVLLEGAALVAVPPLLVWISLLLRSIRQSNRIWFASLASEIARLAAMSQGGAVVASVEIVGAEVRALRNDIPGRGEALANLLREAITELQRIRAEAPKPTEITQQDHAILNHAGAVIGYRHADHPDIGKALADHSLQVRYPDGSIVKGGKR